MKLKPIEENMVVHCKTEDEAKLLIKWAYECGYKWRIGDKFETNFAEFISSCYEFARKEIITHSYEWYNEDNGEENRVILFTDLIISEEQEEHMSTEEIIEWLRKHNADKVWDEVFGEEYGFYDMCQYFTTQQIIEKIETYEKQKEQQKEVEVEWVYKIIVRKNIGWIELPDYALTEEEAAQKCEELAGNGCFLSVQYEKMCIVKEK